MVSQVSFVEAKTSMCEKLSAQEQSQISASFSHSPFELATAFFQMSMETSKLKSLTAQNELLLHSLDLKNIYQSTMKVTKSRHLSKIFFDWVRTNHFGNVKNLFSDKRKRILDIYYYDLAADERKSIKNNSIQISSFKKTSCTYKARNLSGCNSGEVYSMDIQLMPELTCFRSKLNPAFKAKLLMTYSKTKGFKILDIELAGKRIVSPAVNHLIRLKQNGLNAQALSEHLMSLSSHPETFKFPKTVASTQNYLARIRKEDRVPSSL